METFSETSQGIEVNSSEQSFSGDVLVGADGIHSSVRRQLWGEQAPNFTGNIAWRALVPSNNLPSGLIRPMSTAWWGPGKHFVHYYVGGGKYVNCVCVVEKQGWQIESWTESGELTELKADFSGWHKEIQMLFDGMQVDSLFKWALFDRAPMPKWGKGCATLLGDACHPTLPFMAQGAAMAIEDAAVLAGCLKQVQTTQPHKISDALQRYENLRKKRTAGIQLGSRRNAKTFHLSGIKAWLRNRAARAAGASVTNRLYAYDALTAANRQTS